MPTYVGMTSWSGPSVNPGDTGYETSNPHIRIYCPAGRCYDPSHVPPDQQAHDDDQEALRQGVLGVRMLTTAT
jgi:hypothetical protein